MKKVPVFIFLLIFAVMLTACGAEDVEIQNTSMRKTGNVSHRRKLKQEVLVKWQYGILHFDYSAIVFAVLGTVYTFHL